MKRIATGLALVFVAVATLAPAPVAAQEYTCRDRWSGRVIGHPPSRTESQHFENANPRVDCFRKGAPVTSSRDERWERRSGDHGYRDPWGRRPDPWQRRHAQRHPWDW